MPPDSPIPGSLQHSRVSRLDDPATVGESVSTTAEGPPAGYEEVTLRLANPAPGSGSGPVPPRSGDDGHCGVQTVTTDVGSDPSHHASAPARRGQLWPEVRAHPHTQFVGIERKLLIGECGLSSGRPFPAAGVHLQMPLEVGHDRNAAALLSQQTLRNQTWP